MKYHKPTSFKEAVALAEGAEGVTRFLAGGTDVLVQLRLDIVTPDTLVDMKAIAGVKDITRNEDGSWDIGVAVSGAEMTEHPTLGKEWPGLVEAMDLIGSTQVQGRATLVGNLCNGSPAADSVPALMATGAVVTVEGKNGTRQLAVADVPTGPGKTSLAAHEVITNIHIPPRGQNAADAYERFIPRTEMDIAVVGCAVNLRLDGDKIVEATVVMGAVAPTIRIVPDAAKAIIGTTLDDAAKDKLAEAVRAACQPIDDKRGTIEFRVHVAGVLAKRVAQTAYDRARTAH
ncbi:xanthine dehydrogenase family protein subunit M [Cognatishimia sp. SS12]|uniref:FAD binding domain-containing protein n=1 Tax=Cognatishimia sp. SS12 TaxID=2979465 RepID=UPI00232CC0CF|nr:xanthine dehydrogenase family protein subunit M [Cognatishimia sp. SS12]MDC0739590.1 xanthine dehydrogenase family protein subunit M [Cognatishimia sp. SS12]